MKRQIHTNEKEAIKRSLIEQGKVLFSKFGLQKTTISDITKKVGIAVGTFYNYYNSKEELYFDILEKEEVHIKEQFLDVDIHKDQEPKQAIKKLLHGAIDIVETNPLIQQMYFEGNMETLLRKLPPEKLEAHLSDDSESLVPLLEKWQKKGVILKKDPEVLAGLLRSLFVLTLHKKEIGESVYRETIELHIDLMVDVLVQGEG